jgi:hypothetical protein
LALNIEANLTPYAMSRHVQQCDAAQWLQHAVMPPSRAAKSAQ